MTSDKQYLATVYTDLGTSLENQLSALPKEFNKARFVQNCMTVMQDGKADFSKCKPGTVVRTLITGAILGLDFYNGECYAIPYGTDCKFQTDYKGEKKLCKKYSIRPIQDIYAKVVKDGDILTEEIIDGRQTIHFVPKTFNDAEIIGAFAVVLYSDGGMEYETMSRQDIEGIRNNYSKAKDSPAWKNSYGEMAKKTVLRRLCKHIELDFETAEMQKLFEETSDFDVNKKPEKEPVPEIVFEQKAVEVESEETDVQADT